MNSKNSINRRSLDKELLKRFNLKNLYPLKENGIEIEDCLLDAIEKRFNEREHCVECSLSQQNNTFYFTTWEEAKKFLIKGKPPIEKRISQCKIGCPSGVKCCHYVNFNFD